MKKTIGKIGAICALVSTLTGIVGCEREQLIEKNIGARTFVTRYERIKITRDERSNERWINEPLSNDGKYGKTMTTYLGNRSSKVYHFDSGQTWVYTPEGIKMIDSNKMIYEVKLK